eukprot:TRINITY_DN5693_c0_g1_i1.p1 TRINITY_DN5693_c0_g1~~TRINITY_DN5693_c0_g1_i1.p1  ORF type:complete len:194 (-),score=45.19 TRINITY_DN5693_c0_g1_i1:201-716(-)
MPKARGGTSTRAAPAKRGAPAPAPAPARAAAPPAAPAKAAAPSNVPAKTTAASPPAPAPAPQTAVGAPSAGGGFMAGIAQTALGVAGGHIIANSVMNAFGGGKSEAAAPAPAAAAEAVQQRPNDRCNAQYTGFLKCMENNQQNVSSCQWAYDFWNQCQRDTSSQATQERFM